MDEICDMLDTYKGRDKVMRTICYSTKLIGGLSSNEVFAKKMQIISSQMSATRAVLRLFDDIPMLKYTLEYGFGKDEPDRYMSALGVVTNIIDQVYYPIEKISWLAENKVLILQNSTAWDTASSVCWVVSIYLTLMKNMRNIHHMQRQRQCLQTANDVKYDTLNRLVARQKMETLTCIRLGLDLVHAVNTLPSGVLWSSKLNSWQVGLIGTLSSVLGIYQIFAKKSLS